LRSRAWPLRVAVQTASVAWAAWIALNAAYLVAWADQTRTPPPALSALAGLFPFGPEAGSLSIEDYCPFGPLEGVVRAAQGLAAGRGLSFVGPVTLRNLGVLFAVAALVLLTKKTFCSWLCPFGALFEALGWIGRRLGVRQARLPGRWDRRLRRLRYAVLAVLVGLTGWAGYLVFKEVDPFFALYTVGSAAAPVGGYVVLAVLAAGALVVPGAWCHYLCPLGAALDPISRLGRIRITRADPACTRCDRCSRACPQRIPVARRQRVTDALCTNCLRCLDACDRGALELRLEVRP